MVRVKNKTVPHAAKSKYKNNICINIARVGHFLFVGWRQYLSMLYGRQILLTVTRDFIGQCVWRNKNFRCFFRQKRLV